jgi:hypothetical protein
MPKLKTKQLTKIRALPSIVIKAAPNQLWQTDFTYLTGPLAYWKALGGFVSALRLRAAEGSIVTPTLGRVVITRKL